MAAAMDDDVPDEVKRERLEQVQELQRQVIAIGEQGRPASCRWLLHLDPKAVRADSELGGRRCVQTSRRVDQPQLGRSGVVLGCGDHPQGVFFSRLAGGTKECDVLAVATLARTEQ